VTRLAWKKVQGPATRPQREREEGSGEAGEQAREGGPDAANDETAGEGGKKSQRRSARGTQPVQTESVQGEAIGRSLAGHPMK
jgi:hypothetical protein